MKKWDIISKRDESENNKRHVSNEELIQILLANRGLTAKKDIQEFLRPPEPHTLNAADVGIDKTQLKRALLRIVKAVHNKETIIVYADYDADGITSGAILWETLRSFGANVMPYIPHRVDEGYGLSIKGIDTVADLYKPTLIITVDHGVTAKEKIIYANKLGIDVVVTDHHTLPKELPACPMVHTTKLAGAGVSWFVAKELLKALRVVKQGEIDELLTLAAIGTIADMVPLVGPNRSIAKYGLYGLNHTNRVGLNALLSNAGLMKGKLGTYDVSHIIAPRLNAMGRIEHALDALRLLCTGQKEKAMLLAQKLGSTNKERQQLTIDTTVHALKIITNKQKKLIFVSHKDYNQGVIGLVAGKLVEEYYRPAIVVSLGDTYSKASARSIAGFNIVEAIRSCSDILIDVGGHPMAAGFTVETKNLAILQQRLEQIANEELDEAKLTRVLKIDIEIPLESVTPEFWKMLREFEPFGFGNTEPIFVTKNTTILDARLVGNDGKHLKLFIKSPSSFVTYSAIAFGMGKLYGDIRPDKPADIAYTIDMDTWNGNKKLQLKIKDIHLS